MPLRPLVVATLVSMLLMGCGAEGDSDPERMAEEHEGDRPEATAATRAPVHSVDTSRVSYTRTEGGEPVIGYLARPQQADSILEARGMNPSTKALPGIVVIHEWWGLNDNIRAATRRLAGEGYRALAVDLYNGATAEEPDAAQSLMEKALKQESRLLENLQSAQNYLRTETGASRLAILGWCFGGSMTFRALAHMPTQFDAAVVYYGSPGELTKTEVEPIETPILGHFGRKDEAIPIEEVRNFASTMETLDKKFQFYEYDAGHAFANPSGTSYNPEAADTAWTRTIDFLRTHLDPKAPRKGQ